jgi:hypothetical protein
MRLFKPGKQYSFTLPHIYYWGCDEYHFIQFYKNSWISILGNRINGDCIFEIVYNRGKLNWGKIR